MPFNNLGKSFNDHNNQHFLTSYKKLVEIKHNLQETFLSSSSATPKLLYRNNPTSFI